MTEDIKSYIDNLFTYLDTYENRAAEFKTEAFLQTYNGAYALFQALAQQRDKAIDVDQFFLAKIQQLPLTASDLRLLTTQLLITYFEAEADIDGQANRAYMYVRSQREIRQDSPFFENHLLPLLFRDGALHNDFQLNKFFLNEMARFINKFGKPLQTNVTPESFGGMSEAMKLLELARRRSKLGNDLLADRTSLEYDLQRLNVYNKLADKNKLLKAYFGEWKYREKSSFWAKVGNAFSTFFSKIGGAFSSWRYFRLVVTQRNAAWAYYGFIILLFIFLAIYVPRTWIKYNQKLYENMQHRAMQMPGSGK